MDFWDYGKNEELSIERRTQLLAHLMTAGKYIGSELDLFANALNWKRYWVSEIRSYVRGDVLEVGAGIGANTGFLKSDRISSWTCLEPDPELADRMRKTFAAQPSLSGCQIQTASTAELGRDSKFDAILYIDVLEHIADDRGEMERAARLLRENGRIIVLAPAHPFLYSAFDKTIGHFRRYNKPSLAACSPTDCDLVRLIYLDSVGLLASLSNRLLLRQPMPTLTQINFWDRLLVPPSRYLDRLVFHGIGKSIVAVWQKRTSDTNRR
jgi:SAM-dependent methyltransferase